MKDEGLSLGGWLEARTHSVPDAFVPWLRPESPAAAAGSSALVREALGLLERALGDPGGLEHRGAFDLLAADGFVTYACEAALREVDPDQSLREVLTGLVG